MAIETSFTPKELATQAGTDAKRMRAYMRSQGYACGQGNRYALSVDEAHAIIEGFAAKGARKAHAPERTPEEVSALLGLADSDES